MKKIIVLMVSAFVAFNAQSQFDLSKITASSGSQDMVKQAIHDGFYIVRTDFALHDANGEEFVYPDKNYWGRSYSLAIKTELGLVLTDHIKQPWLYNKESVFDAGRYTPFVQSIQYIALGDSIYKELHMDNLATIENLYTIKYGSDDKFVINHNKENQKGWIVWFLSNEDLSNLPDTSVVPTQISTYIKELDFSKDTVFTLSKNDKDLIKDKTVLGGCYFEPVVTGVGQLSFKLSGVLYMNSNEQWQMQSMIKDKKHKARPVIVPQQVKPVAPAAPVAPQPVSRDNKNRKN
ncbi:MAG: hypothetical protein J6M30_05920 [Bacteroidales bacterium]|nr:hypothetical protein [Bacteroidales bacterium]